MHICEFLKSGNHHKDGKINLRSLLVDVSLLLAVTKSDMRFMKSLEKKLKELLAEKAPAEQANTLNELIPLLREANEQVRFKEISFMVNNRVHHMPLLAFN